MSKKPNLTNLDSSVKDYIDSKDVNESFENHKTDEMPHIAVDSTTETKYKWGFSIQNGQWGLVYEVVTE